MHSAQEITLQESRALRFRSVRVPLIAAFVLAVIIPTIIINLLTGQIGVQGAVEQAYTQLETVLALKESQISFWVESVNSEMAEISSSDDFLLWVRQGLPDSDFPTLRDNARSQAQTYLSDQRRLSQQFDDLFLLTNSGATIISGLSGTDTLVDFTQHDAFPAPAQPILTAPQVSPDGDDVVIYALYPIYESSSVMAVLGAAVRPDPLFEILGNTSGLGQTGQAHLIGPENTTLQVHEGDLIIDTIEDGALGMSLASLSDSQIQRLDQNATTREEASVSVMRWLPVLGSGLLIDQTESEILQPTRLTILGNFVIAIISVVLVMAGAIFFIERTISRPIARLSSAAQQIASGNLEQQFTSNRADEIGTLARTFNTMTGNLVESIRERNAQIEQIETLNNTLEQRVNARTRDLQIASNVARQITNELDLDNLLPRIVEATRDGFDLYACFIFLLQDDNETLLRVAGVDVMGHDLTYGKYPMFTLDSENGLVAQAGRERRVIYAPDVMQTPMHVTNPGLPQTQSEAAIPMLLGDDLIGVFDVQSSEVNHFSDDDLNVLQTLAEQITIAVRNAQLFAVSAEARQTAEEASRIKSQFLASMSHELRTPLNGILNFTQIVSSGMLGELNERQVDLLNRVTDNGDHLLALINDVLDISKIEAGALTLMVQDNVDLHEALESIFATAETLLQDKPVELVAALPDDLPPIRADRRRVRQIVLNLVTNACKFTTQGSITVRAWQDDAEIILCVSDTGPGIAEHQQDHIFEVFVQSDTGLASGEGTGLGLPISRRLAEAHGGRLWLESAEGKGATFYVALPIRSQALAGAVVQL